MTDSNNSQRWQHQHLSRRAALRAAILGATIPGALYLAKAANSADAADNNIYIPGAPNFLELGDGWPEKEANAGKISYRRWSDALDIVGAGTSAGYRKVKIWDDLYLQGLLNLRAYIVDPEIPRTWTAFLYAKSVNGQTKPFWKDATGTAQPLVARSATLVVAASNASPRSKLGADFVCDGIADEVEINAAINALPDGGGKVILTEGTFTIGAPIVIQDKCVYLQGQGSGWAHADGWGPGTGHALGGATIITAANSYNNDFITIRTSDGSAANIIATAGTTISDLKVFQDFPTSEDNATNAHGIHPHGGDGVDVCHEIYIRNVSVSGVGGHGIYGDTHEVFINMVEARGCRGAGVVLNHGDSVLNHVIAGGNGLNGNSDNIVLKGYSVASNIYAYGGGRHGICLEGGGTGRGFALTNFWVDSTDAHGVVVRNMRDVTISNGYVRGCGTDEVGENYQSGISIEQCDRLTISGVHCFNVPGDSNHKQLNGFTIYRSNDVVLDSCVAYCDLNEGVKIQGSSNCILMGCRFIDNGQATTNTYSDIKLHSYESIHSTDNRVLACTFKATVTNKTRYAIEEADSNQDGNQFHSNTFDGEQATAAINIQGPNSRAYQNKGYVTENNGTATIIGGSTYVDVAHGLNPTPAAEDISATPTNDLGNASKFWISNVGASTFRINVNTTPGVKTATFAWHAEVL